jgi:hypothetical protein
MFNPCWLTCFDFNFIELKTSSTGMNVIRVNNLFLRMHTKSNNTSERSLKELRVRFGDWVCNCSEEEMKNVKGL